MSRENEVLEQSKFSTETRSPQACGDRVSSELSIFATIAYYDYFNYPLTAGEIFQYLIKPNICHSERSESGVKNPARMCDSSHSREILRSAQDDNNKKQNDKEAIGDPVSLGRPGLGAQEPSFLQIIETLDNSENLKKIIEQKNGFYFLSGREEIIKQRIQKKKLMDQKFKKTKWILRFIACLPFVRLIMLSGSMGLGNPLKASDIDLLVVAKHGRIWTTRAILTFFTLLFGVYRHTGKTENRLCLNHYITDKSLGINFGNLYKAQEYLNLLPLAGDLNIYKKFFWKNSWMRKYVYSVSGGLEKNLRAMPPKGVSLKVKRFFEFLLAGAFGDCFEKYVKKFQVYFIEKNPLTKSPDARIRYDDRNLVFHPVLIEPEVIGRWEEKMAEFD